MSHRALTSFLVSLATVAVVAAAVYREPVDPELPNRIPEAAPYDTAEAHHFPPPYEELWEGPNNPGRCASCHPRVFEEWNGSMMSNSWRDPAWRAAFLLIARLTATDGNCDIPEPPDGTERAELNPFAGDGCVSHFDTGEGLHTFARSGSLLDGFCSRCHMPTNYADNVPLKNVSIDEPSGREHGRLDPTFDPTSDHGTGIAFATSLEHLRNTETGKRGIFCAVCHTMADSRDTPYHNFPRSGTEHVAARGTASRRELLPAHERERFTDPDPDQPHLGYGVGAGSFRLSPQAIGTSEVVGPLASGGSETPASYDSSVFGMELAVEAGEFTDHEGNHHPKFQKAEMCSACHDVTNPLTIKNALGRWVGGFPIERTYAEWLTSHYADRPGNEYFDPAKKRDCQTCHMQQDYGQPGTAQTLYDDLGRPLPPLRGSVADGGPERVYYSHHFIGGNSYVTRLLGTDVTDTGRVEPYPELSVFSFSSADKKSPYSNAYWTGVSDTGAPSQHARMAWDRLRNVLDLELEAPAEAVADGEVPLTITVTNSGSGHNFPSGFPEGRVAWVAVRAFDLATGAELEIHDSHWRRRSRGVGYLTDHDGKDPLFPDCDWHLPAGSPDPYAYQLKAVASLGDGCPTLDLVYATPLNLVVNEAGQPVDSEGRVIDRHNPNGLPQFEDLDGDGDLFDDSYLLDQRLRPLPHDGATLILDRYSVIVPADTAGPVAVTAAVYYQSLEGMVALKFLGNLADSDLDLHLEPCVLGGSCDGRTPHVEPPVVEGAPPVPMELTSRVVALGGRRDQTPPQVATYPAAGAERVFRDVVVKVTFSEPVTGVDATTFTLADSAGRPVPAMVDQIGDGTWGLFPARVFLEPGETYTARLAPGACDAAGNCLRQAATWNFRIAERDPLAEGDTSIPLGFPGDRPPPPDPAPRVIAVERAEDGAVRVVFSEPVMNVTRATARLFTAGGRGCAAPGAALAATVTADTEGIAWTLTPAEPAGEALCVVVSEGVYDLAGQDLAPFTAPVGQRY